jgi:hypothetical protein
MIGPLTPDNRIMKKQLITLVALVMLLPLTQQAQQAQQQFPNNINSGFYIKLGPVFPVNEFSAGQVIIDKTLPPDVHTYYPARMGASMDMGFLIYLGPAFANNMLRAGIDATFINFWFNPTRPDVTLPNSKYNYWYYFVSQKFGPVISINPVDKLIIDLSYKLNAVGSWYNEEYGNNLFQNEVSMNVRYRVMMFSLQYNFGDINYNNFESANPDRLVDISTFRLLIGFKF